MKKRGFTLIELLAVIVILAILALIAIPIVINIINDSRENSHKRSIESYGRNVENAITSYIEKNDVNEIPKTLSSYSIKMSGSKVKCDDEFEYNDEELILTHCRVVDSKGKQKSKHTYTYKNRTLISDDEEGNQSFSIGQEIIVKDEKYNVIGQGSDYVTLLKQTPLTVDEVNLYGGSGTLNNHVNRNVWNNVGTAYNYNGYGELAYYSSPTCGHRTPGVSESWDISGCTKEYNSSDIKYVVDNWAIDKFGNDYLKEVEGYKTRLAQKEELRSQFYPSCSAAGTGCSKESTTPSWLYNSNYWYWTMSQWNGDSISMWGVGDDGHLGIYTGIFGGSGAVRPVINIYKSEIERVN